MPFENVPWFIGGGAEHSPEVARLLSYVAAGDRDGVVGSADCWVRAMVVPSELVRVNPGAVVIRSRYPSSGQQTYLARNPSESTIALTPTPSSGPRTDLVYVEIEDPQYPGGAVPPDVVTGPYTFLRVREGVPANTTTLQQVDPTATGCALARITRPASTGTVEAGHVTSLRELVAPRTETAVNWSRPNGTATLSTTADVVFPPNAQATHPIPAWATRVEIEALCSGLTYRDLTGGTSQGSIDGRAYVKLTANGISITGLMVIFGTDGDGRSAPQLATVATGGEYSIPAGMRGHTATIQLIMGYADGGRVGMEVGAWIRTATKLSARYLEAPDTDA